MAQTGVSVLPSGSSGQMSEGKGQRIEGEGRGAVEVFMDLGAIHAAVHAFQICIIKKGRIYGVPN